MHVFTTHKSEQNRTEQNRTVLQLSTNIIIPEFVFFYVCFLQDVLSVKNSHIMIYSHIYIYSYSERPNIFNILIQLIV